MSRNLYDPARDTFTSSEDAAAVDLNKSDEQSYTLTPQDHGHNIDTMDKHGSKEHLKLPPDSPGKYPISRDSNSPGSSGTPSPKDSPIMKPSKLKRSRSRSPIPVLRDSAFGETPAIEGAPSNGDISRPLKRMKPSAEKRPTNDEPPVPMTSASLPRFSRKKAVNGITAKPEGRPARELDQNKRDSVRDRRRSRSPARQSPGDGRSDQRHPPRRRSRTPLRRRSPTPPPRSPPRKLKRPGGASRISNAERDAIRERQMERDRAQMEKAKKEAQMRGVQDVVREHYNAVPERGREWRKTDSRIRGLRSFNNWVKSTVIQKFSPNEDYQPESEDWLDKEPRGLVVLDMGCGKGGDLGKWQQAPQPVELYVGVDPANVSIEQARDRYRQMREKGGRGGRGRDGHRGGRSQRLFRAEFYVKDAFSGYLGEIPLIHEVGIDPSAGPGINGAIAARWGGGGFDVVSMMFCMHYAFESEAKARGMLKNVAGSLKKGGRLIGTIPNSDILSEKVVAFHEQAATISRTEEPLEKGAEGSPGSLEWGNSIYRVRFPGKTPEDGIFRPPFGWKYSYFMEEAVEEVPEYVVPWEAFRFMAEEYNLELQYKKPFAEVWEDEKEDPILGPLSERMGVRGKGKGPLLVRDEEMEAASFYIAFCFYKT